jgi:hypothetical protein
MILTAMMTKLASTKYAKYVIALVFGSDLLASLVSAILFLHSDIVVDDCAARQSEVGVPRLIKG